MGKENKVYVDLGNGRQALVSVVIEDEPPSYDMDVKTETPSFEEMVQVFEKLGQRKYELKSTFMFG